MVEPNYHQLYNEVMTELVACRNYGYSLPHRFYPLIEEYETTYHPKDDFRK